MRSIRLDASLRTRQRNRLKAHVVDRHRHEGARDALARRQQHVHLATIRHGRDLIGQLDQPIRRLAHRRNRAHHTLATLAHRNHASSDILDLLGVGHRRATELHHHRVEIVFWACSHRARMVTER